MKKELKAFIKANKLSDDEILKRLQPAPPESDTMDDPDDDDADSDTPSESDPKVTVEPAETKAAGKEEPSELAKIIAAEVAKALAARENKAKDPPKEKEKEKAKKPAPAAKPPPLVQGWQIRNQ